MSIAIGVVVAVVVIFGAFWLAFRSEMKSTKKKRWLPTVDEERSGRNDTPAGYP